MHHHVDLGRRQIEQPAGLDHLEALIHERGAIDGDAVSHLPCRMIQGLLRSHRGQRFARSIAEWAARSGQNQPRNLFAVACPQALVRAVMFAIDRDQEGSVFPHGVHHQTAARDQHFLIRQPDPFAVPDGFVGGFQASDSDDGRNHGINFLIDRNRDQRSIAREQIGPRRARHPRFPKPVG